MPGLQEFLVIAVVALLVFGPERLPELARAIGNGVRRVRRFTTSAAAELRSVSELADLEREILALRRELDAATDRMRRDVDASAAEVRREARRAVERGEPPVTDPEAT